MGVFFIVAARPGADQGARVAEILEHVVLQEFVAHAVVQGLHESAQPRLARGYECLECVRACSIVCVSVFCLKGLMHDE